MAHVYTEEQNLVDIANAIREKNGTDNTYAPNEMASAIEELDTENYAKLAQESVAQLGLEEEKTNYVNNIIANYYAEQKENVKTFAIYNSALRGHYGVVYCNTNLPFANRYSKSLPFSCDILLLDFPKLPNNGTEFSGLKKIIFLSTARGYSYKPFAFAYTDSVVGTFIISNHNYPYTNYNNLFTASKITQVPTIIQEKDITNASRMFYLCFFLRECLKSQLEYIKNATCDDMFFSCTNLEKVTTELSPTNSNRMFFGCYSLKYVEYLDLVNNTNTTTMFNFCESLEIINIINWKSLNLSFSDSSKLSAESIDNILENAVDVVDGAEEGRTLQLHATAGANWDANSKYQGEERNLILTQKGIEVTW